MLTNILMILLVVVCVAMVGVVLMQQSEGGALGMGGSPSGFMSARGAGDLLTRITWILFSVFLLISVALTWLAAHDESGGSVTDRLNLDKQAKVPATAPALPQAPANPLGAPSVIPSTQPAAPAPGLSGSLGGTPSSLTAPSAAPSAAPAAPAPAKPKQ